jgi:hypothetical protein
MAEDTRESLGARSVACRQFDAGLAAHLEGEPLPAVQDHAKECPFCRAILADLEQIHSASRDMPLEDPPGAVWMSLRARLAEEVFFHEPLRPWPRWLQGLRFLPDPAPLATLGGLVLLGAFVLVSHRVREENLTPAVLTAQATALRKAAEPPEVRELARTVDEMEKSFQAQRATLDPAVKAIYEKGLESLDSSIDECRTSVEQEPQNSLASEYLVAAYTQKAAVLESALQFAGH